MRLMGMISENEEKNGFDFRMSNFGDLILRKNGVLVRIYDPRNYTMESLQQDVRHTVRQIQE